MALSNAVCTSELFYCYHLSSNLDGDEKDILSFKAIDEHGDGLVEYLQTQAITDEIEGAMRTYLVRDVQTDELVGYFSLKAGLVSRDEVEEGVRVEFDTLPGVELANIALNGDYREKHPSTKGCGQVVFNRLVMRLVRDAARIVGAKILYLFSLPYDKVLSTYESYGFNRLPKSEEQQLHARLKPRYDDGCIFMYIIL